MNKWRTIIEYICSRPEGSLVRRPELLALVGHKSEARTGDMVDGYRLALSHASFLTRVAEGTYRITQHPPRGLSLKACRKMGKGIYIKSRKNAQLVYCDCPVGKCMDRDPRRCASRHAPPWKE